MSNLIDPAAGTPATTQGFEQSDRNPIVNYLGGAPAEGGQILAPAASESRTTLPGAAPSAAGLQNYNTGDSAEGVQDSAESQS